MKKKLVATALIAVLCIALSAAVFTGCEQDNGKTYVSLDINPSVSLILDGKGAVLDVVAENEDAQVLLVDLTLEGKTLEEAVKLVAEASVECGFLSAENSVVDVSVVAENGKAEYESTILGEIERSFSAAATDGGFEIKLNGEGSYTLNRMLEYYKEKYPDNAAVQNMTPAKLDLVLSVTEKDGSISFEAVAQADISSLITMAETAYAEIEPYMTSAYNAAVTEAKLVYENAKAVAESAVWAAKYAQFMIKDLDLFAVNYGAVYAAYDVAAITLDYVLDKAEQAADATDAALAQVDTAKLAEPARRGRKRTESRRCGRKRRHNARFDRRLCRPRGKEYDGRGSGGVRRQRIEDVSQRLAGGSGRVRKLSARRILRKDL